MESIKKNAKPIAIAAGVVAGILGLYVVFRKSSKGTNKPTGVTEKEKDALIQKIKVTYSGQMLSVDTVADVFEVISEAIVSDAVTLSQRVQKLRREKRGNLEQYVKACEEVIEKNDAIAEQLQKDILARLGISEVLFGQSLNHYMNQNHPKLTKLAAQEQQMQAKALGSSKTLTWEEFRPIFKRMTELWETELAGVNEIKKFLKNPFCLSTIMNYRVFDVLHDEFGLQEEEISAALGMYSQQAYVQDPQTFGRFIQTTQTVQMMMQVQ